MSIVVSFSWQFKSGIGAYSVHSELVMIVGKKWELHQVQGGHKFLEMIEGNLDKTHDFDLKNICSLKCLKQQQALVLEDIKWDFYLLN